jgi:heptaprenyl diphosphate synthase
MLLCAAVILSYVESYIPLIFFIPIPGIKLGMANIAVMVAAYDLSGVGTGIKDAAIISLTRICFMALLFGTVTSFWFSLTGGAVSFIMLVFCRLVLRSAVSPVGTAVACAAGHNAGQILAAVLLFGDASLFYFMPWLLIISIFTGIATGMLLYILSERLRTK